MLGLFLGFILCSSQPRPGSIIRMSTTLGGCFDHQPTTSATCAFSFQSLIMLCLLQQQYFNMQNGKQASLHVHSLVACFWEMGNAIFSPKIKWENAPKILFLGQIYSPQRYHRDEQIESTSWQLIIQSLVHGFCPVLQPL